MKTARDCLLAALIGAALAAVLFYGPEEAPRCEACI
jgi:hypothetical protein